MFSTPFMRRLAVLSVGIVLLTSPLGATACVLITPDETYLIQCPARGSECTVTAGDGTQFKISRFQAEDLC